MHTIGKFSKGGRLEEQNEGKKAKKVLQLASDSLKIYFVHHLFEQKLLATLKNC